MFLGPTKPGIGRGLGPSKGRNAGGGGRPTKRGSNTGAPIMGGGKREGSNGIPSLRNGRTGGPGPNGKGLGPRGRLGKLSGSFLGTILLSDFEIKVNLQNGKHASNQLCYRELIHVPSFTFHKFKQTTAYFSSSLSILSANFLLIILLLIFFNT